MGFNAYFPSKMSTVDSYGPASQTLTFLDTEEPDFGADTQGSEYEFHDFTVPSQTQTQSQASQPESSQPLVNGNAVEQKEDLSNGPVVGNEDSKVESGVPKVSNALGELNFEEEDDETFYTKDLPVYACRCVSPKRSYLGVSKDVDSLSRVFYRV